MRVVRVHHHHRVVSQLFCIEMDRNCFKIGTPTLKEIKDYFSQVNDESTPKSKQNPSMESSSSDESLSDSFKEFLKEVKEKREAVRFGEGAEADSAEALKCFNHNFSLLKLNETSADSRDEINATFEEFSNAKRKHLNRVNEESDGVENETSEAFQHFLEETRSEDETDLASNPPVIDQPIYMKTPGIAEARKYFHRQIPKLQQLDETTNTSSELNPSFEELLRKKKLVVKKEVKEESFNCDISNNDDVKSEYDMSVISVSDAD